MTHLVPIRLAAISRMQTIAQKSDVQLKPQVGQCVKLIVLFGVRQRPSTVKRSHARPYVRRCLTILDTFRDVKIAAKTMAHALRRTQSQVIMEFDIEDV